MKTLYESILDIDDLDNVFDTNTLLQSMMSENVYTPDTVNELRVTGFTRNKLYIKTTGSPELLGLVDWMERNGFNELIVDGSLIILCRAAGYNGIKIDCTGVLRMRPLSYSSGVIKPTWEKCIFKASSIWIALSDRDITIKNTQLIADDVTAITCVGLKCAGTKAAISAPSVKILISDSRRWKKNAKIPKILGELDLILLTPAGPKCQSINYFSEIHPEKAEELKQIDPIKQLGLSGNFDKLVITHNEWQSLVTFTKTPPTDGFIRLPMKNWYVSCQ